MITKYIYLLVDLFCLAIPLLFSFHPKTKLIKEWKFFSLSLLITTSIFIVWDIIFTHLGVWKFNPNYITGIYIVNLPIEEVLFFICIPYSCLYTYFCIEKFLTFSSSNKFFIFPFSLSIILIIIALLDLEKLYPLVTFLLLGIFLAILSIKRAAFLKPFFVSFSVILLPFFVSNGILTGGFTEEPIVIYNNHYNLGIRLGTIPVEDVFYGMLLLLLNTFLFKYLKSRSA